jgi:hypothetical protein
LNKQGSDALVAACNSAHGEEEDLSAEAEAEEKQEQDEDKSFA